MAFQPTANCLKHELHGQMLGIDMWTVLHTNFVTPAAPTDLTAAAAAVRAAYVAHVLPRKVIDFQLLEVTTTDMSSEGAGQAQALGTSAGGLSVAAAPAPNSIVIQQLTGIRGRSFRGRVFDGGQAAAAFSANGGVTASSIADMNTAWEAFRVALGDSVAGEMVVVSRVHAKTVRAAGEMTPVVQCRASGQMGVQRRRRVA